MSTNGWWMLVGGVLVAGLVAGSWATLRIARARFNKQLRRATDELQQRNGAMAEQLRSAQARAHAEIEQSRNAFKRQLAVTGAEPRAALERAEERLKAAYAELDRMRGKAKAKSKSREQADPDELTDGFAATRPMHDGM